MTFCKCSATILNVHCETGSIWSHFASAVYWAYQLYSIITDKAPYDELESQQSRVFLILGCVGTMIGMTTSTLYHQYNAMNKHVEYILLKFDHVGIGASIYALSLCLGYSLFHSAPTHRDNIISAMLVLYFCNGLVQLLPCYAANQFLLHKNVLFLTSGFASIILATIWAVCYANHEEFKLFAFRLLLSFIQIQIGFFFFVSHYPERAFPNSRFVCLFLQSHMWWHIFVQMSAATLYWVLYDLLIYLQKLPDVVQS